MNKDNKETFIVSIEQRGTAPSWYEHETLEDSLRPDCTTPIRPKNRDIVGTA